MMQDTDRAWAYGSAEIEREANADAMPPPNSYECYECECTCYFDEDGIGRELEIEWDDPYLGSGAYTTYLCPECAMEDDNLLPVPDDEREIA